MRDSTSNSEKIEASNMAAGGQQSPVDGKKTPRHPRWSRQETLVLIQGKMQAEERGQNGRRSFSVFGSDQVEAKWDYVSSHCRRNGVSRGPIQCRKRWSNLLSDFKKIRAWDSRVAEREEGESFWAMRSDFRRERKLPGFFDREVYNVLDGKDFTGAGYQFALVTVNAYENNNDGLGDEDEMANSEEAGDVGEEEKEADVTSLGKEKVQTDDKTNTFPSPVPISEMRYQPLNSNQGKGKKNFRRDPEFQESVEKRKRPSSYCANTDADIILNKALEINNELLSAQLEDQKSSFQLARDQNKEQHERLIAALTKITGVLERMADKL